MDNFLRWIPGHLQERVRRVDYGTVRCCRIADGKSMSQRRQRSRDVLFHVNRRHASRADRTVFGLLSRDFIHLFFRRSRSFWWHYLLQRFVKVRFNVLEMGRIRLRSRRRYWRHEDLFFLLYQLARSLARSFVGARRCRWFIYLPFVVTRASLSFSQKDNNKAHAKRRKASLFGRFFFFFFFSIAVVVSARNPPSGLFLQPFTSSSSCCWWWCCWWCARELNEFRRERVIHSFFFRKITHKKKKKKRREINWSKKFGRQHTKTHKKKKFSTRFFIQVKMYK